MTQTPQAPGASRARGPTRLGRVRARLDRIVRHPVADGVVMTFILVSVALLIVEIEEWVSGEALERVVLAGHVITGFFVVELATKWFVAPSTKRFWQDYWLDVIAVIPFFRALRLLRVLRLLRLYRFGVMAQRFVKRETDFNKQLAADTRHYRGDYAAQVWLAPDLYNLLGSLLEDGRVHAAARHRILAALAYFIAPYQVLPQEEHGAEGYLDQVYVGLEVVRQLAESELPEWLIEDLWEGEGDVCEIAETDLPLLRERLGPDAVEALHHYLGLEERAPHAERTG